MQRIVLTPRLCRRHAASRRNAGGRHPLPTRRSCLHIFRPQSIPRGRSLLHVSQANASIDRVSSSSSIAARMRRPHWTAILKRVWSPALARQPSFSRSSTRAGSRLSLATRRLTSGIRPTTWASSGPRSMAAHWGFSGTDMYGHLCSAMPQEPTSPRKTRAIRLASGCSPNCVLGSNSDGRKGASCTSAATSILKGSRTR